MIYVGKSFHILQDFYRQSLPFHHYMFWVPLSFDTVNKLFFFHIFPAIHWILTFHPHFRNSDLSSGQWQHRLSLLWYRRKLFTLALKPKFCKFYSPGAGTSSSLYGQGKGLTGVRQLASTRWLNHEDMESRIWTHY